MAGRTRSRTSPARTSSPTASGASTRRRGGDGISVGVVPSLAASLGNVSTYAGAGIMLRLGSELDADFGPPRVRPASARSVFYEPSDRWGWYGFVGVEGRAVLRDIPLDGPGAGWPRATPSAPRNSRRNARLRSSAR
ncbi:lipid A-modifier LpxR family protein [Falsiroseomonas sp. HW251]|uniref:lipid A-modifier LpxR family protein n=1 Tax=Falsiroseomonas sp. HW251 TaxID=3390998 RepID=UPI003D31E1BB